MRSARLAATTTALVVVLAAGCGQGPMALTVPDALATEGEVLVEGYVFSDPAGLRLCEAVAESFPPRCGGKSLVVEDALPADFDGLRRDGDRYWSDSQRRVRGTVDGETIRVSGVDA